MWHSLSWGSVKSQEETSLVVCGILTQNSVNSAEFNSSTALADSSTDLAGKWQFFTVLWVRRGKAIDQDLVHGHLAPPRRLKNGAGDVKAAATAVGHFRFHHITSGNLT